MCVVGGGVPKFAMNIADESTFAAMVAQGKIGIFPTDTVYGLVCSARDEVACARLYAAKRRDTKPGTVLASSIDQLVALGIKRPYLKASEDFWNHAISVVIPCGTALAYLHLGRGSLAARIPRSQELREALEASGPLLTTSANLPGESTAKTIEEAHAVFGGSVDFYIDGGYMGEHKPSTVIRIVDDAIEVLREGAVELDDAGRILREE